MYPVYLKNVLIRHVAEPRGRESVEEFASVKGDEGVRTYKRGGEERVNTWRRRRCSKRENFARFDISTRKIRSKDRVTSNWNCPATFKVLEFQTAAEHFGTVDSSSLSIIRIKFLSKDFPIFTIESFLENCCTRQKYCVRSY